MPGYFWTQAHPNRARTNDSIMAHQLVLFINLFGLFLFDAFFLADVNISQNVPATMAAGSEVRVTVNVTKGNLGGFAKLELDLPPGLSSFGCSCPPRPPSG